MLDKKHTANKDIASDDPGSINNRLDEVDKQLGIVAEQLDDEIVSTYIESFLQPRVRHTRDRIECEANWTFNGKEGDSEVLRGP